MNELLSSPENLKVNAIRYTEFADGSRDYEAEFITFRHKSTHFRFDYASYWGDTQTTFRNPSQTINLIDGLEVRLDYQSTPLTDFGGLAASLQSPIKEIAQITDAKKPVITIANSEYTNVSFSDSKGEPLEIRILKNGQIEIRYPNPGFPGFQEPSSAVDLLTLTKLKSRPSLSLFEAPKSTR
ncbi:hypothetical protein CCB80_08075 [Armatimonadetes bacterium Uphvl-Ar1]|nr:hypothetical protein CCB80_08075 [Armatimonadetes bacterium Uphvl-Ar1]